MTQNNNTKTEVELEARRLFEERDEIGRKSYGKGLDYNDPMHNWINMAIEELIDLLKYLIALKLRTFANMVRKNKHKISSMDDEALLNLRDQIDELLEQHNQPIDLGSDARTPHH